MRNPIAALISGLFWATALTLSAQTYAEDISRTPGVNMTHRVDGLTVGNMLFNNVEGGLIDNPYDINLGNPDAKPAMELAQTHLTSLDGWTDQGGISYYDADPAADQDRMWVTAAGPSIIPEPSTALIGLLGLGFMLGRKRA